MFATASKQQHMRTQLGAIISGPVLLSSTASKRFVRQQRCCVNAALSQQAVPRLVPQQQQASLLHGRSCNHSSCCSVPLKSTQVEAALSLSQDCSTSKRRRVRLQPCHIWGRKSSSSSSTQPPDPWRQEVRSTPNSPLSSGEFTDVYVSPNGSPPAPEHVPAGVSPLDSYDPWDAARPRAPVGGTPEYDKTDWGWDAATEDWDPAEGLGPEQLADLERDYLDQIQRRRALEAPPRDKWITPLLDWQAIYGAFDPDQSRTEDAMADEALTNKEESREALSFLGRLVVIPLVTGALISRAITEPVLSFSLQNNPNAFGMTERQKIEGASAVHMEETRVKMMMAIGMAPPLDDAGMLRHLQEYAQEVQEEERHKNEANLMTLVSDSISAMVFFAMFVRDNVGRAALFNTIGRLFEGLSDIAKAVLIILVADTLLGYHSEEGWTGLLDLILGHYGFEIEEENIVLFVGIIPIAIDVMFKYWIFIGLNRISPGAVVTIKQLDRH